MTTLGPQPSGGAAAGQEERRARPALRGAMAVYMVLLAGCTSSLESFYDSKLSLDEPVDWWHQLEGGAVAQDRPPPPGITDPYPNLGRVPAKPTPTDPATRNGLLAQLQAQRDRTRLLAAQDPVRFPPAGSPTVPTAAPAAPPPSAPPGAAAAPAAASTPAPAADSDVSTAVLDAASAAPAPKVAAVPAPPANDPAAPAAFRNPPPSSGPVVSGPIPPLPTAAPPLPSLPGLPTAVAAPVVARERASASFRFGAGSAALPEAGEAALRTLATQAAGGPIAITAGGDATSSAPDAQGAALPLALRRTGAMTAALIAAGASSGSIRAQAVAPGREATARLVD